MVPGSLEDEFGFETTVSHDQQRPDQCRILCELWGEGISESAGQVPRQEALEKLVYFWVLNLETRTGRNFCGSP